MGGARVASVQTKAAMEENRGRLIPKPIVPFICESQSPVGCDIESTSSRQRYRHGFTARQDARRSS